MEGHETVARLLLEQEGVQADARSDSQCTALSFAAEGGHFNIAKLLLDKGCSPHIPSRMGCTWMGPTPLCKAIRGGHDDIVQLMQRPKQCQQAPRDLSTVSKEVGARLKALYGNRQRRQHSE